MEAGQLIAERYELLGILGRGGMGEVYLAHDRRLEMDVALKRVPLELALEPEVREALVREARILARLSHTNIVRLFDLADTVDGLFLVLEYVCGPSLDKVLLKQKTLSPDELRHVVEHVAQGLARAHSLGVIHRDLKPSNLLVQLSGDERRHYLRDGTLPANLLNAEIKVTDFGLAKVILQSRMEASGAISGTPAFMAPEQFRGEPPSVETDVYALGFTAYVCLAGGLPIGEAQPMFFHLFQTPPPLMGAPGYMNAAIQKAVRKERADRFRSALDFAAALREPPPPPQIQAPPVVHQAPPMPPPVQIPVERPMRIPVPVAVPIAKAPPENAKAPPQNAKAEPEQKNVPPGQPPPVNPKAHRNDKPRGGKAWQIAAASLGVAIVAFLIAGLFLSRQPPAASEESSAATKESSPAASAELAPLPPLNPAPRLDALPPVIEQARPAVFPYPLPHGIDRPVIVARARLTGSQVVGFGPEGTLYVTSNGSDIGSFRQGRLAWQYRLAGDSMAFTIGPDGLIWIRGGGTVRRFFCFNAAGQGGELVDAAGKAKYDEAVRKAPQEPSARCLDTRAGQPQPAIELLKPSGVTAWRTPLDFECRRDAVVGRSGKVLAQTEARTVYLIAADGRVLWTYAAPCDWFDKTLLSNDTALGRCNETKTLVGVRDGKQIFSISSSDSLPKVEDREGNFYRLASTNVYDERYLMKTDPNGRDLWTLPLNMALPPVVAMGPDGKIYLLSDSPAGSSVIVLEEKAK